MVIAWPKRIKAGGDLRRQFTHCIDIVPTVLELADIPEPKTVDGIQQEPMDGTSFRLHAGRPEGEGAPHRAVLRVRRQPRRSTRTAGGRPRARERLPWDFSPETLKRFGPGSGWDPDRDAPWELYYLPDDFSQAHNIAAEHPTRSRSSRSCSGQEAERNRVLPLMGGLSVIYGLLPPLPTITRFTFAGDVENVQRGMMPRIFGRSYAIEAELVVPRRRR